MVDNDETTDMARPAVIIAAVRSGGTFLSHCLSNHTSIFCDRGEPIHHLSIWSMALGVNRQLLLTALLNQTGYQVSMCRLTYRQAFHQQIWPWLVKRQPRVIWLRRDNLLRQAISLHLNKLARTGKVERPLHTFGKSGPINIEIEPAAFLDCVRDLDKQNKEAGKRLKELDHLYHLTYVEMTGGDTDGVPANQLLWKAAIGICDFLQVREEPMACDLKRINPYPLPELIGNWAEVERAVRDSDYAGMLEMS